MTQGGTLCCPNHISLVESPNCFRVPRRKNSEDYLVYCSECWKQAIEQGVEW